MKLSSRIFQQHHHYILIDYLSQRFTYLTPDQWIDKIESGLVLVNDLPADPQTILRINDFVSYDVPDFDEPKADLRYEVIYEDEWIVGINKSGNLLVHKSGASLTNNLVYQLRHVSNNPAYAGIHSVNRLDRETSGVVLFSKNAECLKTMHRDFASGKVEKEYIAIVKNPPQNRMFTIDTAIGPDANSAISYKFCVDAVHGKQSETRGEVLAENGTLALLRLIPKTGRTHQLRVHCASIGSPILGDKLYGLPEDEYIKWRNDPPAYMGDLGCARQALHCSKLTFSHPVLHTSVTIIAPLPPDMKLMIEKFGWQSVAF